MRQEVYRVAYDEASAELSEILAKFELLRVRKDRIEKVVDALKPLVIAYESTVRAEQPIRTVEGSLAPLERQVPAPVHVQEPVAVAAAPAPVPVPPSPIPYPVQQAVEEANDPFSRRVESAIGAGSSSKDLREYSRLFSTGTSR